MMHITSTIYDSFQRSFQLYRDLVKTVDEVALSSKLSPLPSNTIGQQLWCVIGARESFSRALMANKWSGFACSLNAEQITRKAEVLSALKERGKNKFPILGGSFSCQLVC